MHTCNTQPTSSVPYILTAIAKHKACGQSKEKRKRHRDYINSWHGDRSTAWGDTDSRTKAWNLPHWKVHTANHHHVSLSRGKAEDGSKKKLLSLRKLEYMCFRTPLSFPTDIFLPTVFEMM